MGGRDVDGEQSMPDTLALSTADRASLARRNNNMCDPVEQNCLHCKHEIARGLKYVENAP